MKVFGKNVRLTIPVCFIILLLCTGLPIAKAQTLTVSPSSLSFGIPTLPAPAPSTATSAPANVTVNITSGSVTFLTPTISSPFAIASNSCTGTQTAPATCLVTVTLTTSTSSSALVTGTLSIPTNVLTSSVSLSGAYGAIKLFDETTVEPSSTNATFANLVTIGSAPLNLSCPTAGTGTLSRKPDGSGNVLVDNYLTVTVNGTPVTGSGAPTGNVCRGGSADTVNGVPQNDCFNSAYGGPASSNELNGTNTDTLADNGGVAPIGVSLPAGTSNQVLIQALDAGGWVASSSLFLQTACSVAGITPGGTVTGNPITSNPSSQTQTLSFDNNPGQNISITTSQANSGVAATGVTPIITDIGISQAAFSALIAGTSAAPAVCLRLTGEVDPLNPNNYLCKGFLIQCFDPVTNTTTGDKCVTTALQQRKLYDAAQFTSPDTPDNTNYLGSSCGFYLSTLEVSGGVCAPSDPEPNPTTLIGPGFLMGSDNWLSVGGSCAFPAGTLFGNVCPLDTLTQFKGAADPLPGSTSVGRNSVLVPVVNMPLPFTKVASTSGLTNGWSNGGSATVTFMSYAATYKGVTGVNPPANGFAPQPIYNFTYGVTPAGTPIPDTTYPVAGDTSNPNSNVNPNFMAPICTSQTPSTLTTAAMFSGYSDGIYNVHYFATDCAFTQELLFNPTSGQLTDPTANWASFPVYTFGVDTQAPTELCNVLTSPAYASWYNTNVAVQCSASDPGTPGLSGSGFAPASGGIQGSLSEILPTVYTTVPSNSTNPAATVAVPAVQDLAGNQATAPTVGPFMVDLQAPTITGPQFVPSGNAYIVGQGPVTITYSCSDGIGSGVATCSNTGSALPAGASDTCVLSTCTVTFTPGPGNVGAYKLGVSSKDNVGNSSSVTPVSYSIGYSNAPANMLFGPVPALAVPGRTLDLLVAAIDATPQKSPVTAYGANVALTLTLPTSALNGSATAFSATVTCTSFPCTVTPTGGNSCSLSTSTSGSNTIITIGCSVGTINDVFTSKSGSVVRVTLPISPKAQIGKTIAVSGKLTAASPINGTTSFNAPILIF